MTEPVKDEIVAKVTTGSESRSGYSTDCLTCGDVAYIDFQFGAAHRRWALRHVNTNPGHTVHMERTATVVYRSNPPVPSSPEEGSDD